MNVWALKLQMVEWLYRLFKPIKTKIGYLLSRGRFVMAKLGIAVLRHPIALARNCRYFFIRFIEGLPFSGFSKTFNQETVATLVSFLCSPKSHGRFQLEVLEELAFPFTDGNIGNVGALPLFALIFKALGKVFPYFQTFDYFVFVDILSCFLTAYFAQKILAAHGVRQFSLRSLGALLTGLSFLVLTRSAWTQPFCMVAFPIFTAWIYAMMVSMQRGKWQLCQDIAILSIYPIAALLDNYSLFAILLGTVAILTREMYEAYFGGAPASRNRSLRLLLLCIFGSVLSVLALYVIGMFPLPSIPPTFSSYDFGMGGDIT